MNGEHRFQKSRLNNSSTLAALPKWAIGAALLVTTALLAALAWQFWDVHEALRTTLQEDLRLQRLCGDIVHLDEVLTMSCRMAAATGDPAWQQRYRTNEPRLDAAIEEARALAPDAFIGQAAAQTDAANVKLVEMENRAFAMVRRGNRSSAWVLLASDGYEKQKRLYAEGLVHINSRIRERGRENLRRCRRALYLGLAEVGVGLPVILFVWLNVLRLVRSGIAQRKRDEEALRASQERYRRLAEGTSDWVWEVDAAGRYTYSSPKVKDLLGYDVSEVIGRSAFDFMPDQEAKRVRAIFESALARGAELSALENVVLRKDGTLVVLETNGVPFRDSQGKIVGYRGIDRDISQRKQAEEDLRELNTSLEQRVADRTAVAERRSAQLRALACQLTTAEQRERRRVAHILHENLQQLLVAARMKIEGLSGPSMDEAMDLRISQANDLIRESIEMSRSLTAELSPPILHELGLSAALMKLAEDMKQQQGLTVHVKAEAATDTTTEDLRVFLFQAVRELLFNVAKHAGATEAWVQLLEGADGSVQITVRDEGVGFDQAATAPDKFGLFSIRERIQLLEGDLEVHSAPGRGTCVTLTAPVKPSSPAEGERAATS